MDFYITDFEVYILTETIQAEFVTLDKKLIGEFQITFDFFRERANTDTINRDTLQKIAEDNYSEIIWDDNTDTTPDPEHN